MFLVTGATGQIGRRVVRLLREQNQPVRAFVRLTSRYAELEHRGAELFIGNLQRDKDIQKACQGVKYVISAHGTDESSEDAQTIDYQANIELIDQAKAAGAEHFTFLSVLGVDRGYEDAPVFKAKWEVEKYLKASGLNYTILRPSGFASNLLPAAERFRQTSLYLLIGDPKNRTSIVSSDDLARIAVESATREKARNQVLSVGGPEILQREDIPKILSRIFNRDPIILNLPLLAVDGLRSVIGLFNPKTKQTLGTFQTLLANEFFCSPAEIDQLESIFEIKMEPLESFFRRYLGV
ncbi:MAG TPA: SDR family oxidoreductase [Candidatus Caenarcaniphilales bacterium]